VAIQAKPFQAMGLIESGGFDELHWGDDQLALRVRVMAAS
jgi:L-asparaginase II